LVFAAWGKDIELLKIVAAQLEIFDRLVFVPVSGKRKMVDYLRSADCLLDQFKVGYYGATGLEAAACGLPVIIRLEHAQYDALCEEGAPPVLNAGTSTEVVNALELLARNPQRRREIAADHRDWFLKNQSGQRWADDYYCVLGALALGHRFSFAASPLAAELSPLERLYHSEQLAAAPQFPIYENVAVVPQPEIDLYRTINVQTRTIEKTSEQVAFQVGSLVERAESLVEQTNALQSLINSSVGQLQSLVDSSAGNTNALRNLVERIVSLSELTNVLQGQMASLAGQVASTLRPLQFLKMIYGKMKRLMSPIIPRFLRDN
jgi:uncharacterized protein YoxC